MNDDPQEHLPLATPCSTAAKVAAKVAVDHAVARLDLGSLVVTANVWQLWQFGHPQVVLPKPDELGEQWALSVLLAVSPHRPCRWVRLAEGQRLANVPADDLHWLLAGWSER